MNLQDHGDPVWYRNLRLKSLTADDQIDTSVVVPATVPDKVKSREQKQRKEILERKKQKEKAKREKAKKEKAAKQ